MIQKYCCCSITKVCLTLCDPMDSSTPGFPVFHYLLEFSQTHVHWVSGAYPTISSSVTLFSSCPQSFPASGSFPMSHLFISGSQTIGTSASTSASVLSVNIQGWFPLGLIDLISLLSKELSRVLKHHGSKASILQWSVFFMVQFSHPYMTSGKTIALTICTLSSK